MAAVPTITAVPITAELVRGALDLERGAHGLLPQRLPARARAVADPQLAGAAAQGSGVRLVLRTAATLVELDVHRTVTRFRDLAPRPDCPFDLVVDGEPAGQALPGGGTAMIVDPATFAVEVVEGPVGTVRFAGLPAGEKTVEIWLPHYERVELVELRTDAPVAPVPARGPVWVHYGSSISQGSNAAQPTGIWPVVAARLAGVELVNLGFSGSAMLDQPVARVLRDLAADLISVKVGINIVNADVMRMRAFTPAVHGFLDTIRDGHPETPLLVVSPVLCPMQEDVPGPAGLDLSADDGVIRYRATGDPADVRAGRLTLRTIRAELARIVDQRADPHLHLLDGRELYGEADAADLPLPDRLHPDAATQRLMGERFAALAFGAGGAFVRSRTARS
ncbi:SGNH/GDSL hydrolase family protein [Pseudonocardia sp. CA-107938]|uniref:SGNH/GDSL hydrolase family protein n=1 Tax=Pseudonocardia sp. CA-107938 TaxID=3240021 RepID=UPI003D918E7A